MASHRIDLQPLPHGHGKTPMAHNGKIIGSSVLGQFEFRLAVGF
jgi:hypothetical protein